MAIPKGVGGAAKAQLLSAAIKQAKIALQDPATQAQLAKAREALQDPEMREAIASRARTTAHKAKSWKEGRDAEREDSGEAMPTKLARSVTSQFGQGRAEKRIASLRSSLETLGAGRPELVEAFVPVEAAIVKIEDALAIAASLPVSKRHRAYARIDEKLDELEDGLLEAALGDDPGSPETDDS